jgi:phosphoribosylanthranilate isomerase
MKIQRTRVKICGITRAEDATAAVGFGADALGFVFYPSSPRYLSLEQAIRIGDIVPAFVSKVGLFADASAEDVELVCSSFKLDYLQFHGEESVAYCEAFDRPYLKAIRVKQGMDLIQAVTPYKTAAALLLDTWHPEQAGGTGERFDWSTLEVLGSDLPPLILAGGLNAGNVRQAITQVRPYAVDVSSGVEESPGLKSVNKISQFINEVNSV